jgi:hypothetical protein
MLHRWGHHANYHLTVMQSNASGEHWKIPRRWISQKTMGPFLLQLCREHCTPYTRDASKHYLARKNDERNQREGEIRLRDNIETERLQLLFRSLCLVKNCATPRGKGQDTRERGLR